MMVNMIQSGSLYNNILEFKTIYCWKCGIKFDIKYPYRIEWHCKLCPRCSQNLYSIFDRYHYEHIAITGFGTNIGIQEEIPNNSADYETLRECGLYPNKNSSFLQKGKYKHIKEIWNGPLLS